MKTNPREIGRNNSVSEIYTAGSTFNKPAVARYQAIKEHLCCNLNGEAVILSMKNGKYYGLNSVASRIWELIQTPVSAAEIENVILLEYEVESEDCKQAVAVFLKQMAVEGLIVLTNETVPELH